MGRFAEKHPKALKEVVGRAIANGQTAAETHRQLAAGTLAGWTGPYQMPLETVRYCGKQYKRKRQAQTISPEAAHDAKAEVDRLARLLLTAAQRGVEASVARTEQDPKALKEWADALKAIQVLVTVDRPDKPAKGKREKPVDALTARLTSPSLPSRDVETGKTEDRTETDRTNTDTATDRPDQTDADSGGVAAQAPIGPQSAPQNGGGEWPRSLA